MGAVKRLVSIFKTTALLVLVALPHAGCGKRAAPSESVPASVPGGVANYTYEVTHTWPHDDRAFTQGLVFHNGSLIESTGINGMSSLREVEWQSGKVLKMISVPAQYFAEGLAIIGDRAYQLTWRNHKGFIYNVDTFQLLGDFSYTGEGWGLTTDGQLLILSDGTSRIRFLDPKTFAVVRTIDVRNGDKPVDQLNELEYIRGEIFANVWQTDQMVRIDPASGKVVGVINFAGLLPAAERGPNTDVLNGIAYDPDNDRLIVTGKFWPKLFEVRLKRTSEGTTNGH